MNNLTVFDFSKVEVLLPQVSRPARYIGGEINIIKKDWEKTKVKFCIVFPDVYEVGMSHLGVRILYDTINRRRDSLCERAFSPWPDFEAKLREASLPLFSLESKIPLRNFDIIGFSLTYELSYTNVLNSLSLSGIPLRSKDRAENFPLIIAGGPCVFNPEPMAEFIDLFVIGEAEEVINEIINTYKSQYRLKREALLKKLSRVQGVYVPGFYEPVYNKDGSIKKIGKNFDGAPYPVKKRFIKNLDKIKLSDNYIVPYIQIVHDRIPIEIMRGCFRACKFCQAYQIYKPHRFRAAKTIERLAGKSCQSTGYEQISLLSLSSGDHPSIVALLKKLSGSLKKKGISISLPSLRVEDHLDELPALLKKVSKSTLTFAPEAGSERLRAVINKKINIDALKKVVSEAYRQGWRGVKLYFMIGLPTETLNDLDDMTNLIIEIANLRKNFYKQAGQITVSVNAFIPKSHTPLQWRAFDKISVLAQKKRYLCDKLPFRNIKLDFNDFERSTLEAVISRGDRRLSSVIEYAFLHGCKFDGWSEYFNYKVWLEAFEACALDIDFYLKEKTADEVLPWDIIGEKLLR